MFSAAPAVALAGMAVLLADKGAHSLHQSGVGMIAGGVGMVAYAGVAIPLLRRMRASSSSAASLLAWVAVAAVVALPLLLT